MAFIVIPLIIITVIKKSKGESEGLNNNIIKIVHIKT